MLPVVLFSYFLLACAVLSLVFLPEPRAWVLSRLAGLVWGLRQSLGQTRSRWSRRYGAAARDITDARTAGWAWITERWPLWSAALALVLLPPLAVYLLRDLHVLDGYAETPLDTGSLVAKLLQGEQLVPPPPLPPEVFTTAEVELLRPMLADADRKWELLDPEFRQRLLLVFKIMKEQHGYELALLEGYRSPERQAMLQTMGPHVTNAGAFQSYHQYGLAADTAFYREGRIVISEKDPWAMRGYELYGQVAESVGLTWGGRWRMRDFGHIELRRAGVATRHRQQPE
ncbi:M15 family metallopeptidase [Schlegelella sp. S2-27]|uniref:M15 family metallopeptidase n=1 Tax=Caldimonas mangrovi TaxID=2944811 RepID=A0ABT0YM50_9BURK|nr:M15 family metallopeptidase [Caldimonas mangrovi]MCM5679806.1 M15 family metallopeptidase [Caldimonas mangrovi]